MGHRRQALFIPSTYCFNHVAAASTGRLCINQFRKRCDKWQRPARIQMLVLDVTNQSQLDTVLTHADDSMVIVNYTSQFCGPCKVIAPEYDRLSELYSDVVFLKCIGGLDDATKSPETALMMSNAGVRSLPCFHFWKNGKCVAMVDGADAAEIEDTIQKHM